MATKKPFPEMTLNERRAYLKAAQAFFRPRLKDHFADAGKMVADKPVSHTKP